MSKVDWMCLCLLYAKRVSSPPFTGDGAAAAGGGDGTGAAWISVSGWVSILSPQGSWAPALAIIWKTKTRKISSYI